MRVPVVAAEESIEQVQNGLSAELGMPHEIDQGPVVPHPRAPRRILVGVRQAQMHVVVVEVHPAVRQAGQLRPQIPVRRPDERAVVVLAQSVTPEEWPLRMAKLMM